MKKLTFLEYVKKMDAGVSNITKDDRAIVTKDDKGAEHKPSVKIKEPAKKPVVRVQKD